MIILNIDIFVVITSLANYIDSSVSIYLILRDGVFIDRYTAAYGERNLSSLLNKPKLTKWSGGPKLIIT